MTASCGRIGALVMRMQRDFLEMPELALTLPDAQQRFGVNEVTCEAVLAALVDAEVLAKTREGSYVRLLPRLVPRAARAGSPRRTARAWPETGRPPVRGTRGLKHSERRTNVGRATGPKAAARA